MKKYFFRLSLLTITALIISCNKNEDDSQSVDLIIGKWEYSTQFENDVQFTQNDCKASTIEFNINGNRNDKYYDENISNECVIVDEVNSTWTNINSNTYQFNQNGQVYTENVTFENSNNRLILIDSDTDGSGNVIVYKFIYNRVN